MESIGFNRQEVKEKKPKSFQIEKGSVYVYLGNGRVQRTVAEEESEDTYDGIVFVEDSRRISEEQTAKLFEEHKIDSDKVKKIFESHLCGGETQIIIINDKGQEIASNEQIKNETDDIYRVFGNSGDIRGGGMKVPVRPEENLSPYRLGYEKDEQGGITGVRHHIGHKSVKIKY